MYAILRRMRSIIAWKIADNFVIALIALFIGLLFTWWAGVAVFLLGGTAVVCGKAKRASSLSHKDPEYAVTGENEWYYYRYGLHHGDTRKD